MDGEVREPVQEDVGEAADLHRDEVEERGGVRKIGQEREEETAAPAMIVTPMIEWVIPWCSKIGNRRASGKSRASASGRPPARAPAAMYLGGPGTPDDEREQVGEDDVGEQVHGLSGPPSLGTPPNRKRLRGVGPREPP